MFPCVHFFLKPRFVLLGLLKRTFGPFWGRTAPLLPLFTGGDCSQQMRFFRLMLTWNLHDVFCCGAFLLNFLVQSLNVSFCLLQLVSLFSC